MSTQTPTGTPVLRRTPLHDVHHDLGAHFTGFAGWEMPVRYTSDVAEHHAVRTAAGLFDLSHMGEIEVAGPGAAQALDAALVSKPSAMRPGQARYSMVCAEDGGILDDLVVYRLAAETFLVVANASNVDTVVQALTVRSAAYDASVSDVTDAWALLAVQGPAAAAILATVTTADLAGLRYYTVDEARVLDADVLLARTGYTGEDGFEIYCAPEHAERLWAGLSRAGASHGLVAAGLACRDTLRLEAGMPLYGNELDTATTPFEVGLGRVVSFAKEAGFVGEEALAERRDAGPARALVGLASSGRRSPRTGYAVLEPGSGRIVGRITSGAPSPTLGHPIAMASLDLDHVEPGTPLVVDVRGSHEPVRVVELPFYRRNES
jgi:aminomethyltransferase